jgi:hypothetical protein
MNKKIFTLDDFIGEKADRIINPKLKISDFSEIKISAIDPRIRKEIEGRIKNIRHNLSKLKQL